MPDLFLKILNMSISASWLVLAVLLLRFLLKKAPKWLMCALWAIVALRLLVPFSIESVFSLVPSTQTIPPEILTDNRFEISSGVPVIDQPINNVILDGYFEGVTVPVDNGLNIMGLCSIVWAAGICVMVLYSVITYLGLRHQVSASLPLRENIYLCDYIDSPFILGIIKPKIYLPSAMDQSQWNHVLSHERAHLKRRDHWWKPLGFALLCLHWFNPMLWVAYILLCRDIELACDEKVIRELGEPEKKAYSAALLACSVPRQLIAACPLAFGEVGVKERVKTVLDYKKPTFWVIIIAVIALIVTAVCFLTDPVTEPEEESAEFRAAVLQSGNGAILVEPAEGSWERDSSDQIWVTLPEGTPSVVAGDTVRIVYDGMIASSYPAQISSATLVEVLKDLEYLSKDYSLNRAILDGCVASVNGDVVAGQKRWQEFMDAVSAGKPASVRLVTYYTSQGPEGFDPENYLRIFSEGPNFTVMDLSYDGNEYRLRFISDGYLYDNTYPYLLYYSGVKYADYLDFSFRDYYVLSSHSDLSWDVYWDSIAVSSSPYRTFPIYTDAEYASEPTFAELEGAKRALEPYMAEYRIATLDANELTGRLDVEVYEYVDGLFDLIGQYVDTNFVTVVPVKGTISFTDWDLSVTADVLDNRSIALTFSPTGDRNLGYGSAYTLEEYADGRWQEVPMLPSEIDRSWPDVLYLLNRRESTTVIENWQSLYGPLSPGTYRITRTIYDADEASNLSWVCHAEFTITQEHQETSPPGSYYRLTTEESYHLLRFFSVSTVLDHDSYYVFDDGFFRIMEKASGQVLFQCDLAQSDWKELPYTQEQWEEAFAPAESLYPELKTELYGAQFRQLSDNIRLLLKDGTLYITYGYPESDMLIEHFCIIHRLTLR